MELRTRQLNRPPQRVHSAQARSGPSWSIRRPIRLRQANSAIAITTSAISGAFKNALDWLVGSGELYGRRVAVLEAGEAAEGIIVGAAWNGSSTNPKSQDFIKNYFRVFAGVRRYARGAAFLRRIEHEYGSDLPTRTRQTDPTAGPPGIVNSLR